MYNFKSTSDVIDAAENPYNTSDLDMFVASLGRDVKIVMSAQDIEKWLKLPNGTQMFISALREIIGAEDEVSKSLRSDPSSSFVIDTISERIGVFGLWEDGEEDV